MGMFTFGVVVGAGITLVVMSMLNVASNADDEMERYYNGK